MRRMFSRLFAIILLAGVLLPILPVAAHAAGDSSITLRQPDSSEGEPFQVSNMFPGESVTKEYIVKTQHSQPITLNYHADLRPDDKYEKLAEVLEVRIDVQNSLLYEGLMAEMPGALTYNLPAGTNEVTYRITVSLDTSVGNEYMNQELMADFRWWFQDNTDVAVKLTAEKLMDGQYARGNQFSFVLKDSDGKTVSTAKNQDGIIEFDALYFPKDGTYTYTIHEAAGTDIRVSYDSAVYTAVITVAPDESYTVTYLRNGAAYGEKLPRFTNVTRGHPMPEHPSDCHPSNPKTGDDFPLTLVSIICGSSLCLLVCLLLLWKDRKKEADHG